MRARLHGVIACLLAALYGLVGLTGESLQYLVAVLESRVAEHPHHGESTGFWHSHRPDHHWHYHHGHSHGPATSQNVDSSRRGADSDWGGIALRLPIEDHSPHACPLLTVVSTLKLGHATLTANFIDLSASAEFLPKSESCWLLPLSRCSLARGPPAAVSA